MCVIRKREKMLQQLSLSMKIVPLVVRELPEWVARRDEREQTLGNQLLVEMDGFEGTGESS